MFDLENKQELINFISENVIGTAEASEILGCSRQYIDQLVKQGKLIPIKQLSNNKLFLKSDINARKKQKD